MKVRTLLVAAIVFVYLLPTAANADFDYPKLPWYEITFFPLGSWISPLLTRVPDANDPNPNAPGYQYSWTEWNARNNAITWENYTDYGLDFAHFDCAYQMITYEEGGVYKYKHPHESTYRKRFYSEPGHSLPGLVECNRIVLDGFRDLNVRAYLNPLDVSWIMKDEYFERYGKYCFPVSCGGQGEEPVIDIDDPPVWPAWGYSYCDETDFYDLYYEHYDDQEEITGYPDSSGPIYEKTFAKYENFENLIAFDIIDEPEVYEVLPSKVIIDYSEDHGVVPMCLQNILDHTGRIDKRVPPDVDNYDEWVVCHVGEKVVMSRDYPFRQDNPPNSAEVYEGYEIPVTNSNYWPYMGQSYTDMGFYGYEKHLLHGRGASLAYDVPFWHIPGVSRMGTSTRIPTPRELRAEINMALTYGAKGFVYFAWCDSYRYHRNTDTGEVYLQKTGDSLFDKDGNEKIGSYPAGPSYNIAYSYLYNYITETHKKLWYIRNELQTTKSLDAFHSFNLDGHLPSGLIYEYFGMRNDREYYPPDYTEETDYLDFGTFVCPYTGVRYVAISDRFCNWPPGDQGYEDPTFADSIVVRHDGVSAVDIYESTESPYYEYDVSGREEPPDGDTVNNIYRDVNDQGDGAGMFSFLLRLADGRIFRLDPTKTENAGFEWDVDFGFPPPPPFGWEHRSGSSYFELDETEKRKGRWSLHFPDLTNGTVYRNRNHLSLNHDIFRGMHYRLSAYVMADGRGANNDTFARLRWNTGGNVFRTMAVKGDTDWIGPSDWIRTYVDFVPNVLTPGTTEAYVEFVAEGTGEVWFDEVRLEPLSRVFNGHFEHGKGDYWFGPVNGWGYNESMPIPTPDFGRYSPGRYGTYCLRVGPIPQMDTFIRNDEKLYLSKGTNYAVTGWAKKEPVCPQAEVIVEFYTTKDYKFNVESHMVPTGDWQQFTIAIAPNEWTEYDFMPIPPNPGKPAYVKIACKVPQGSSGSAYFDNIELIETNPVPNGSFELAEEGPHRPDRWRYSGSIPTLPPGAPGWSALYDADSKYDRRCWRVRTPSGNINYASETFVLDPSTQYRLSGWLRNFDVELGVNKSEGCKLKINLYDSYGNSLGSYTTDKVTDTEEWTYKYVDISSTAGKRFARVVVVEEEDAYSSAADGIRVLPTSGLQ